MSAPAIFLKALSHASRKWYIDILSVKICENIRLTEVRKEGRSTLGRVMVEIGRLWVPAATGH